MTRDRRLPAAVWLATAALVAGGALLAYHSITRVDALAGLKENVIMGRLIPAGTGGGRYRDVGMEADEPLQAEAREEEASSPRRSPCPRRRRPCG